MSKATLLTHPNCHKRFWVTFLGFAVQSSRELQELATAAEHLKHSQQEHQQYIDTNQPTYVSQKKFLQSQSNTLGTALFGFQQVFLKYFKGGLQRETLKTK